MNSDSAANSASSRFISRLKSRSQAIWRIPVLLLSLLILAAPQAHAQTSPVLDPIGNRSVNEGALLTFTATASDDDVGDTLTFSLDPGAPVGAAINPLSGVFTWTPTEAQGPASVQVTVRVTDNGTPALSDFETITVTVNEVNVAPVLGTIGNRSVEQGALLTFTASATDGDLPANTLTFSLGPGAPAGASINPLTGVFTWTPTQLQGPGDFLVTVQVTDNGTPAGVDSETITISVTEDNTAPVLNPIGNRSVDEETLLTFTATASDANVGDTLTFSLDPGAPVGAAINPLSGVFTWTPTEAQGPASVQVTVRVTDNGTPALSDFETITVTVNEVNVAPAANDDSPPAIDEGGSITNSFNVLDNDTDADGNALTAALVDGQGPANADNFNLSANGNFIYLHDGGETTSDSFTYEACDDGTPQLCDTATVTISIDPVNDLPEAVDDGPFVLDEGGVFDSGPVSVLDNDTDAEDDPLTAFLVTPPVNDRAFTLDPDGTFTYTHDGSETVSDSFTYRAEDGEGQSNTATVTLTINPVNDPPSFVGVLPPGLVIDEDTTLTIPVSALDIADPDTNPANFSLTLDPVLPPDADYTLAGPNSITPAENFNGTLSVRATVNDGELDSAPFQIPVTVTAVNDEPALTAPIEDQNAVENSPFSLDISGNFSDADGDTLTFSATGLPNSFGIDPATGVISGTPRLEDARDNDPYEVTVTASDPAGTISSDLFDLIVSALDRANLALTIAVSPDTGLPSDDLRWTFTALNPLGPQPGSNVVLRGSFVGSGLTVTAEAGANCTIDPPDDLVTTFVCVLGTLPVGASTPMVITTTTSEATEVVAFATAAGAENLPIDPNEEDNSAVEAAGVADAFSVGAVQILGSTSIRSVAAGDVNVDPAGDSVADIVVGTAAGQPVQIYLNDAPRESCDCPRDFLVTPLSIPDTGSNEGVALADLDDDGDLDLVVANGGGQPDRVFANDGDGNFSAVATLEPSFAQAVAIADFDLDGNLDIAIAEIGARNRVYLGDGTGGFPGGPVLLGNAGQSEANSFDVAVADLNGDGRPDLVFANVDSPSEVWFADAAAGFVSGGQLPVGDAVSVAAGDLNGDGRADLVFGRVPAGVGDVPSNPVLVNDGTGGFGEPAALLGISPTNDVHIGDVNNDGSPDLVFINASGVHQIWTANGGGFSLHREQIIDIDAMAGVLANLGHTDTDVPGGLDLAMGGAASAGVGVYLNDAAGNLGRGDVEPPVISLNGSGSVSIESGLQYSDAGAAADDNIDGDVSADIRVTNNVNTAIVGSYTVSYNVTDFAGNAAVTVTRTVNVTPAAGSGGGGGGSISYWAALVLLGFLAAGAFGRSGVRAIRVRADTRKYKDI